MASVTMNIPDKRREKLLDATDTVDYEYAGSPAGAHVKCLIYQTSTITQNTVDTLNDITGSEVSGTNYVAGGNSCANGVVSLDASGNVDVDFDDPSIWLESGTGFSNARRLIFAYDNGGAQSTWPVVAYSDDFGADKGNTDGDFEVTLGANGLIRSTR